jgi:hypothetical protein
MYCNPCHTCVYSDCDPETCVDLHDCHDWEEFYNKDGSVKEDDNYIFVDDVISVVGKIKITDINEILKERTNESE